MATRQEEVRNLTIMRDALILQDELAKKIKSEEESIKEQRSRWIPDHPEYEPKWSEEKKEIKKEEKKENEKSTGVVIAVIQWIVCLVIGSLGNDAFALMQVPIVLYGVTGAAIVLNLIVWRIDMAINAPVFGAFHGLVTTGSRSIISAVVTTALYFRGVIEGSFFVFVVVISVALPACVALTNLIWLLINKKKGRADAKKARLEEKAERERRAAYDKEKAAADVVIAQKRKRLAEEVQKIVASCQERIARYKEEITRQERIVAQTPGLAMRDKNLYTVSTLLIYFERGKIDSIKEGINLFDIEERQKSAARAAAIAAAEQANIMDKWRVDQQDALEKMATIQRRHNEKMEEEARKARERVEDELDRLNR